MMNGLSLFLEDVGFHTARVFLISVSADGLMWFRRNSSPWGLVECDTVISSVMHTPLVATYEVTNAR